MALHERDGELSSLRGWLRDAQSGLGRMVFVAGEAGVGKSALVRRFCDEQHGVPVAVGVCDASLTPRPLGPVQDLAARWGGALRTLLEDPGEPVTLFRGILDELGATGTTIVVVEDVHWADEATLDLLRFVGRRVDGTHAMVVATYRDDETSADHPLRGVLGDVATSPGIRRLRLAALSAGTVAAMAQQHGAGVDVDALHAQTGGNPFFVTEVLAAGGGGVPQTVRDAVLARAARLAPQQRLALEAAAVVPTRVEIDLLLALAGVGRDDVDGCVTAGMLVEAGAGTVAFRHELARAAVEDSLPPARRLSLHDAAARLLGTRPGIDPGRVAYHAAAAGNADLAREYATAAARHAHRLGAHREAEALFATALRFSDGAPPAERADLLEGLAQQGQHTGAVRSAADAAAAAVSLRREVGDTRALARTLKVLSQAQWDAGESREAETSLREAITLLARDGDAPALAECYSAAAAFQMLTRNLDGTLAWSDRAIAVAERTGASWALARALNARGAIKVLNAMAGGRADLERSMAVAESAGLTSLVTLGWCNLGSAAGEVRDYATATPALREAIRHAEAEDNDLLTTYSTAWLARVQLEQGEWSAAASLAESLRVERSRSSPLTAITALTVLGRLAARRGDPRAGARLNAAWRMAAGTGDLQRLWPVAAGRAELAWFDDRVNEIADLVEGPYAMALDLDHRWACGELAVWLHRAGALDAPPRGCAEPHALHLAGRLRDAAEAWGRLGCTYEAADTLADSDDEDDLRAALASFDRLGAVAAASRVRRRLRELGVRNVPRGPRRVTASHPAHLTPRETDVLALLADGHTDAAIAKLLYIAPKTVGHHVSAVLRKLGAASRGEAAALARRRGLLPKDGETSRPT